jgi:purine-binding chemotaxis protein CheW
MVNHRGAGLSLFCRIQGRLCALPLERVRESMRPLPIEPLGGASTFVSGLAVIRGETVPIVDAARLFGACDSSPGRWVTLTVGERCIALAVDSVQGVLALPAESLTTLPALLREAGGDVVEATGVHDAELLLLLASAHWVPEELWTRLDAREEAL